MAGVAGALIARHVTGERQSAVDRVAE
jgi:hypothetical protein